MNNGLKASRRSAIERTTCARCHGLLVPGFTDSQMLEITEHTATQALRCVNCGEWIDPTIAANRRISHPPGRPPFSRRRWR